MAERCVAFSRSVLVVAIAAGDSERRLAVDEVEAGLRDNDLVVLQLEATLSKCLALTASPLQLVLRSLVVFFVATWKYSKRKRRYSLETLWFVTTGCSITNSYVI